MFKVSFFRSIGLSKSLIACGTLAALAFVAAPAFGQGVPEDWSHHHLVFSNPGSYVEAVRNGNVDHWQKIVNDPRFQQRLAKRGALSSGSANAQGANPNANPNADKSPSGSGIHRDMLPDQLFHKPRPDKSPSDSGIHRDWSMALESTSTTTTTGSSTNITVIDVTSTSGFSIGEYIIIGAKQSNNTEIMLIIDIGLDHSKPALTVLRAQLGSASGATFSNGATVTANIRSFLTSGVFPAKYSFSTNATANCSTATQPDFVVYPTFVSGTSTTANIIAFDDIYSGCAGYLATGPPVYWAYNTVGDVITSPILSGDGKQVAFLQTPTSATTITTASTQLVVLKYKAGEGSTAGTGSAGAAPVAPTTLQTSGSNCLSASGSCSVTLTFAGTAAGSGRSSPFVDYLNDILYVGDDYGQLHKFTGVFKGTPAEVTTAPWPVQLGTAPNQLSSPVYDAITGKVFIGGANGVLYSVVASTGTFVASTAVLTGTEGVSDAPIVDSQAARVYVLNPGTGTASSQLVQFPTSFGAGATGTTAALAASTATVHPVLFSGTFDNQYFNSTQSSPTGAYYVCAGDATATNAILNLYRVPITSNVMGTATALALGTVGGGECSPVTEFFDNATPATTLNGGITNIATSVLVTSGTGFVPNEYIKVESEVMLVTAVATNTLTVTRGQLSTTAVAHLTGVAVTGDNDWLFLGVTANGAKTGCAGACLYSFSVTGNTLPANAAAGLIATGGTTGLVIDNKAATAGAAQVYYSPLADTACTGNSHPTGNATGGCAIQASQAALK